MSKYLVKYFFVFFLVLNAPFALSETDNNKGLEIAIEADKRDSGFSDYTANVKMILKNRQGDVSVRNMRYKVLEQLEDGDKSILIFDTPRDIRGVAALTYSHKISSDDQWLYMPEIKRTKRIATANKSGPFMGSEYAYEDISSEEIEKYTYKYIKDSDMDDKAYFIVERYPVDVHSGYSKQIVWFDKQEYRIQKIEYYDRKNSLLKTRTNYDYQKYLGKFWRPGKSKMNNIQTGKVTIIEWRDYNFKQGLTASQFTVSALKLTR